MDFEMSDGFGWIDLVGIERAGVEQMSDNITRLLRGDEGEVLTAYPDHLGYLTIGVGRLIDKRKGGGITPEESAYLLANDIMRKSMDLDSRLP